MSSIVINCHIKSLEHNSVSFFDREMTMLVCYVYFVSVILLSRLKNGALVPCSKYVIFTPPPVNLAHNFDGGNSLSHVEITIMYMWKPCQYFKNLFILKNLKILLICQKNSFL